MTDADVLARIMEVRAGFADRGKDPKVMAALARVGANRAGVSINAATAPSVARMAMMVSDLAQRVVAVVATSDREADDAMLTRMVEDAAMFDHIAKGIILSCGREIAG